MSTPTVEDQLETLEESNSKPPSTNLAAQPVADKQRIQSLDLLRGFAVQGILLMNITGFGIFLSDPTRSEQLLTETGSINFWMNAVITILFEGKMRALFCMLFGAGIMLFAIQKAEPGKKGLWRIFYLRMFWLVLFGLLHAHVLLWLGDILYFYGLFGMLVFLLRNIKPHYKALGVPIVALLGFVMGTLIYQSIRESRLGFVEAEAALASGQELTESQQESAEAWREIEKMFLPNAEESEISIRKMRGSYSEVASEVRPKAWESETTFLPALLGDNIALMLMGMALLQWGFFSGDWSLSQYRRLMWIGYTVGLPLVIFSFWRQTQNASLEQMLRNLEERPIDWYGLIYPVQRIFLVMAHTSLIMILFKSGYLDGLKRGIQAIGKMAFTNYILQTVLCTLFFFGYGLGYYDHLQYYQLYFVVAAIWAISFILSPIWLDHFRFGPLEWLWRCLTYCQWQPMRRTSQ